MKKLLAACAAAGALALPVSLAPAAIAAPVNLGSVEIPLPDFAPIPVATPFGLPASALPLLPAPWFWVAPAPPVDRFGGATEILDCRDRPSRLPGEIIVACGDGNMQFIDLKWESWEDDTAVATEKMVHNDCVPACAYGTMHYDPVRLTLHDVRNVAGHRIFSYATVQRADKTWEQGISGFQFPNPPQFTR